MSSTTDKNPFSDPETHPSWGMVQFVRRECGGPNRLFASSLPKHGTTIALKIMHAVRHHETGRDWYVGDHAVPEIVEVELSAAQFAALLTTMNVGDGVPCTLRYVHGERMPDVPEDPGETGRVRQSVADDFKGIVTKLEDLLGKATDVLAQKTIKAGDRKDLLETLRRIRQDIESNLPFMVKQFEEATEKITTAAKAEVDAFVTTAATRLGIERLRELGSAPAPEVPELAGKKDK